MTDTLGTNIFTEPDTDPEDDFPTGEERPYVGVADKDETPERKPSPSKGRKSGSDVLTLLWGGVGLLLVKTDVDPPVGRTLQLQAPMAGVKLDAILAHTWLDGVLQPLFSKSDAFADLGALFALPAMVGLIERKPEAGPFLEPFLREVVTQTLADMVPVMKKKRREAKRNVEAMADLSDLFPGAEIPADADPVDVVYSMIFGPGEEVPAE